MEGYITLLSSVKHDEFPNNSNSTFTTRLQTPLVLPANEYEIGLVDILYPSSWKNVTEGKIWCKDITKRPGEGDAVFPPIQIRNGKYTSLSELEKEINNSLRKNRVGSSFSVIHDDVANQTFLKARNESYEIKFSNDLSLMLGFECDRFMGYGEHQSKTFPDINQGFTSLFVYCDLVEERHVGNVRAPLLRLVPTNTRDKFTDVYTEFRNIQYHPTVHTRTDLVSLFIRRDNGEEVPFTTGKVAVTVHLRKKVSP